jgi:amino-acid N-acetyltransferase
MKTQPLAPTRVVRRASPADAAAISAIVNGWAARGEMLPRSPEEVAATHRDFLVVEEEGEIVGCGALALYGHDLAEIRSLAVRPDRLGCGIGAAITAALIADADAHEIPRVIAFTYRPGFFERFGFRVVPGDTLPRKAWTDCVRCPKRNFCDEVAMLRERPGDGAS